MNGLVMMWRECFFFFVYMKPQLCYFWMSLYFCFFGASVLREWEKATPTELKPYAIISNFNRKIMLKYHFYEFLPLECYTQTYYYARVFVAIHATGGRVLSAICNHNKIFNINCNVLFMTGYRVTTDTNVFAISKCLKHCVIFMLESHYFVQHNIIIMVF